MNQEMCDVRCEQEIVVGDQRVVHAYGRNAGGYVYIFGLSREVVKLVDDYLYEVPGSAKP